VAHQPELGPRGVSALLSGRHDHLAVTIRRRRRPPPGTYAAIRHLRRPPPPGSLTAATTVSGCRISRSISRIRQFGTTSHKRCRHCLRTFYPHRVQLGICRSSSGESRTIRHCLSGSSQSAAAASADGPASEQVMQSALLIQQTPRSAASTALDTGQGRALIYITAAQRTHDTRLIKFLFNGS